MASKIKVQNLTDNDLDMMIDAMTLNCGSNSSTIHQHQCLVAFEELRKLRQVKLCECPS